MIPPLPFQLTQRIIFFCQPRRSYSTADELLDVPRRLSQVNSVWRTIAKEFSNQYLEIRPTSREASAYKREPRLYGLKKVRYLYVVNGDGRSNDAVDHLHSKEVEAISGSIDIKELWIDNVNYLRVIWSLEKRTRRNLQELHLLGFTISFDGFNPQPTQLDALRHLTIHNAGSSTDCPPLMKRIFPSLSSLSLFIPEDNDNDSYGVWTPHYFEPIASNITTFCLSRIPEARFDYHIFPLFVNLKHFAHFLQSKPYFLQQSSPWNVLRRLHGTVKLSTYTTSYEVLEGLEIPIYNPHSTNPTCITAQTIVKVACIVSDPSFWSRGNTPSAKETRRTTRAVFESLTSNLEFIDDMDYDQDPLDSWEQVRRSLD